MTVKTLNHLNKEKKDIIYNLEPDEFTKLINQLHIKQFDYLLTEIDITQGKILSEDFKIRKQKKMNYDDFLYDILRNMPDKLIDKTKVTFKTDLEEFRKYQVNRLGDLLNENFKLLERKETMFNMIIGFLFIASNLSTLQTLILYNKRNIDKNNKIIGSLALSFSNIDFYIDLFTNTKYKSKIKAMFNENTLKLIEHEIKNHNDFLKNYPAYKELYEMNRD